MFSGFFVAIHAMWGNDVEVKSYKLKENNYQGIISIKFFDHFGLGKEDMVNPTKRFGIKIPDLAGIRAWYVLQHWDKFGGKYKPFVDYSIVDYEFEGDLMDTKYNYIKDKLEDI